MSRLLLALLLIGCQELDRDLIVGSAKKLAPHDCALTTNEEHAERVFVAASQWAAVGCFVVGVQITDDDPEELAHHVSFQGEPAGVRVFEEEIREVSAWSSVTVESVLLHELGHHFGLSHSEDLSSVMNAEHFGQLEIEEADRVALAELCSR